MSDKLKPIDPIPDEFATHKEAADFWDSHSTMDYPEDFETVAVDVELKRRRLEVEVDADLMKGLSREAKRQGMTVHQLVSEMLREKLRSAERV